MKQKTIFFRMILTITFLVGLTVKADACEIVASYTLGENPANKELQKAFASHHRGRGLELKIRAENMKNECAALRIEAPDRSQIALLKIKTTDETWSAYVEFSSLQYNIPTCREDIILRTEEHLKNCYKMRSGTFVESPSYSEFMDKTKQLLERKFARRPEVMIQVLAANNYAEIYERVTASLIVMERDQVAQDVILSAHHFTPDLFSKSLWAKGTTRDLKAERILSTILFLNSKGKGFVDVNLGGGMGSARIVDLHTFRLPAIGYFIAYDLDSALSNAMLEAGYK